MAVRKDNGQGSMYYDEGKGYWYAEIQWRDSSDTKRRKKFSGKSKAAVKKKLDEFKKELLLTGPDLGKRSVIFEEFAETWLNTKLKISLKPTSFMRTSPFDRNSIWYMEDTFYALISVSEKVLLKDRYLEEYLFDVDSEYFFKNGTDYKQLHRKIQYPQLCRTQTEQIAVHLELLTSLCRECYADLAMALLTDCTFDEYYTCVYLSS